MSSVLYDVPGPKARRISLIASIIGGLLILGLLAWVVMTLAQQGIFEARRWQIFTRADVWRLLGWPMKPAKRRHRPKLDRTSSLVPVKERPVTPRRDCMTA